MFYTEEPVTRAPDQSPDSWSHEESSARGPKGFGRKMKKKPGGDGRAERGNGLSQLGARDQEHQKSWESRTDGRWAIGVPGRSRKTPCGASEPERPDSERLAASVPPLGLPPAATPSWSDTELSCVLSVTEPLARFLVP